MSHLSSVLMILLLAFLFDLLFKYLEEMILKIYFLLFIKLILQSDYELFDFNSILFVLMPLILYFDKYTQTTLTLLQVTIFPY